MNITGFSIRDQIKAANSIPQRLKGIDKQKVSSNIFTGTKSVIKNHSNQMGKVVKTALKGDY